MTVALGLSLWLIGGSLMLAILDGLGPHPTRRLLIGVVLTLATAAALWRREALCDQLRVRPALVLPIAAIELGAAAADGLLPAGPYAAFSVSAIALAVIVTGPRLVWLCVMLLDLGYATAILVEASPAALIRDGQLDGVLGAMLAYPLAALVGLGLVRRFSWLLANAEPTLDAMRRGAPVLTPALAIAIRDGGRARETLLLPPAAPIALTRSELKVVDELARGVAPKQIARQLNRSVATVRSHIKHAKRKTGARTLAELVAMAALPGWPGEDHRGR